MKKSTATILILLAISITLTSCATLFTKGGSSYRTAVAAYEKQAYTSALYHLAQALSVNPEFPEALELFPKVFQEGNAQYKKIAAENTGIEQPEAADRVLYAYTQLQKLHETARDSGRKDLNLEDFTTEIQQAKLIAADLWFTQAQNLEAQGDRENLKLAVAAYETARDRNPTLDNINATIARVLEQATVTVAVAASGPGKKTFAKTVLEDVTKTLSENRFVKVIQKYDFFPGPESMVGPLDIAIMEGMKLGWDYVLDIYAFQNFEEIDKETPVTLPSEAPLFSGIQKTLGYQHNTSISYRLFDLKKGVSVIVDETVREIDGPYEYTYSYVPAEGIRELTLDTTGRKNLRFVTTTADDITTDSAISTLRWDYESIQTPPTISNPADQTQWIAYYQNKYTHFTTLAAYESSRELFYAIEVVHHKPTDTYFMIGSSLQEAITRSQINSAIMNALHYTAKNLLQEAEAEGGHNYLKAGTLAAEAVKDFF